MDVHVIKNIHKMAVSEDAGTGPWPKQLENPLTRMINGGAFMESMRMNAITWFKLCFLAVEVFATTQIGEEMEEGGEEPQPAEEEAEAPGATPEEADEKPTPEKTELASKGTEEDPTETPETTRDGERPADVAQETETSRSADLPETPKASADVNLSADEPGMERATPSPSGRTSAEKLQETLPEEDKVAGGGGGQTELGGGQLPEPETEALDQPPESQEGRRQDGEGGLGSPVVPEIASGASQEMLSNEEQSDQNTEAKTNQEESGASTAQTALSGTIPGEEEEEESVVSVAVPGMLFEDENRILSAHPLSLSWVFGYNSKLPVFNLLDEDFRVILYVSGHTAVIHDILRNKQYLLQGHSNCISCICVSEDRRWIATADRSREGLVIIWDSYSAIPVHTIFDSHPEGGVGAIAISHDYKFLATVGAGNPQIVKIWKWTSPATKPICSVEILFQYGFQEYIAFSCRNCHELVSNSQTQVIFYKWDALALHCHAPLLTNKTFDKVVGIFSQSLFHFSSGQVVTGTMEGKLVVWDAVRPPAKARAAPVVKPYNIKAIKLVHLQKEGITALTLVDKNFVTCDVKGHVKFYDGDFQLLHWYSQFKIGPIRSVSFSKTPACPQDITKFPTSSTLSGDPFVVRNFILATVDALVIHIKTEEMIVSKCLEEPKDAVHAIACHPKKPLLAKGSYCGLLKVWDYQLNKYLVSRIFKGQSIRSLCYNHDGSLLAAGYANGNLCILDSISLGDECTEPFDYSRGPIILMSFSHNSQYLATADERRSVNVYKQIVVNKKKSWEWLASLRAHYKPIRSLLFGVYLDSNEPRLLSLGEDRMLVEYDLKSSVVNELVVLQKDRIEQSAVPKCITWYPPLTLEHFFLTANDQYKMKMHNATTKLCRKTALGPAYGSPLEKILVLPLSEGQDPQKRYLAYITKDKVGIQILPVDGNPHRSLAFICHPAGVSDLACSCDGCHLFTAGGNDLAVMKWDVNLSALEAAVFLGGEDLIPFYNLLDGGREGDFFKELEDYFYYAQLCHQGIDTMEPREVSTHIPLEQIPFVMRAMGFYPTEDQIENMLNEVKFGDYLETGKQETHINLGDFIKLYINHRPSFGLAAKEIENAFRVLGYENENGQLTMNRDDLLLLLQHRGEHMTEDELAECLTTLLGANPEGGRSEVGSYDPTGAEAFIEEEIPLEITAAHFTSDILCLPIPEPPSTEKERTSSSD